tara:strand:- start:56 stop:436 length:381 start_codon:yes stop_codon:yes gene_type:complete
VVVEVPVVLEDKLDKILELENITLVLVVMAEHLPFQDLQCHMQVEVVQEQEEMVIILLLRGVLVAQVVVEMVGMMMEPPNLQQMEPPTKEVAAVAQDLVVATTLARMEDLELLLSDIEFHKIYTSS